MQLRPEVQLKSVIKALQDVVGPAMDTDNKLAIEQLQLCVGLLSQMIGHLPRQFAFDLDELKRLCLVADEVQATAEGGDQTAAARARLTTAASRARAVLANAGAGPEPLLNAVRSLRSELGGVITAVNLDGEAGARDAINQTVLKATKAQLLRDRSWVLAQGFEPEPDQVPAIETLIESPSA